MPLSVPALPQAPVRYDPLDQDRTRRLIEQALERSLRNDEVSGFSVDGTPAAGNTIYYHATNGPTWSGALFNDASTAGTTVPFSVTLGTITTDKKVFSGSATWNNGATQFFGFRLYITNTASAAGSYPFELRINGNPTFLISTAGTLGMGDVPVSTRGVLLNIPVTAAGGVAWGWSQQNALTASANNDALTQIDVNGLFVVGSFTGLTGTVISIAANSTAMTNKYGIDIGSITNGSTNNYALRTNLGTVLFRDTNQVKPGTITAQKLLRDDEVTWNEGSTIFRAWQLKVLNTASNATSSAFAILSNSQTHFAVGTPYASNSPLVSILQTAITGQTMLNITTTPGTGGAMDVISLNTSGGTATETHQMIHGYHDGSTTWGVTARRGIFGLFGGLDTNHGVRIGGGNTSQLPAGVSDGRALTVGALFNTNQTSAMTLLELSGSSVVGGTWTTTNVYGQRILTFLKGTNHTITNWYGIKIEAPPTATNRFALHTNGGDWVKNDATYSVVLASAALATTATDGFLYIPTCAGTPTGTPTTRTGCVAVVYDSTNQILYAYSGGAWNAH